MMPEMDRRSRPSSHSINASCSPPPCIVDRSCTACLCAPTYLSMFSVIQPRTTSLRALPLVPTYNKARLGRRQSKGGTFDLAAEERDFGRLLVQMLVTATLLIFNPSWSVTAVVGTPLSDTSYASGHGIEKPGRFVEAISDDGHHQGTTSGPSVASSSGTGPAHSPPRTSSRSPTRPLTRFVARLNHLLHRHEVSTDELPRAL